jgi:uncharacterized protein YjeT (DUF2065 family)
LKGGSMLDEILRAVALVMVIEGILPFLSPVVWKRWLQQVIGLSDQAIRVVGLISMLSGVLLLYAVN